MKGFNSRGRLLTTTMIAGAMATAGASMVSTPAQAQEAAGEVGTVVITGSRIVRQDYVSNSPITTVGAETIANSGAITAETVLNQFPQFVPSVGSTSNNPGGSGAAQVDLRGMGVNRNLVLINGRRAMPSFSDGTVDINTIPGALIQKVEVVSGGASAVYGADAVAGAVNFILKNNFQGFEASTQYGRSGKNDAETFSASAVMGGNFAEGKGNAVLSLDYANRAEMNKDARDFANDATTATSFFPMGGYFVGANAPTQEAVDDLFATYGVTAGSVFNSEIFSFNPDGSLFNNSASSDNLVENFGYPIDDRVSNFFWTNGGANPAGRERYSFNFEPPNKLILPLERTTMTALGEYNFNESLTAYTQVNYTNYNATSSLAPSPAPTAPNPDGSGFFFSVPYDNPYVPDDLATLLASRDDPEADWLLRRRFIELGPRQSTNINNIWNVLGGLRGEFSNGWLWDVWASHGRFDKTEIQDGNVQNSKVEELLDAEDGGDALCGGFNPFGYGTISEECADYVRVIAKNATYLEQDMFEATVSGDLFDLPAGTVSFAVGTQYRSNDYRFIPDQILSSGDISGFNVQQELEGSIDSLDYFTEVFVPLVRDVSWAQEINMTLGARYSEHSNAGGLFAYKAEGEWAFNDSFRVRGSYQTAIRAPNISELFAPQNASNPAAADPCNVDSPQRTGGNAAAVTALCEAQLVAAGLSSADAETVMSTFIQGTGQIGALVGGNPNVSEETADTYTLGLVFRSPIEDGIFSRLTASLDWYSIDLVDAIGAIGAAQGLSRCYDPDFNESFSSSNFYCALFQRDPGSGDVRNFQQFTQNLGGIKTSGVDFQVDWRFGLDQLGLSENAGDMSVNFVVTYLNEFGFQPLPGDDYDQLQGTIDGSIGTAFPEWKWTLTTSWKKGPLTVTPSIRYIGAMEHAQAKLGIDPSATGTDATYYMDVSGSYDLNDTWTVRAGINNLLDQEPRIYAPAVQANTDPQTYDIIGRRYFLALKARF